MEIGQISNKWGKFATYRRCIFIANNLRVYNNNVVGFVKTLFLHYYLQF